jgi:hypothetical protein
MEQYRYDIQIQQESPEELHIWVIDNSGEHDILQGVLRTDVPAVLANSFKNDLTDALRHRDVQHNEIPVVVREWLNNLEEKYLK